MNSTSNGVNPLRPYYLPPSIGEPSDMLPTPDPHAFSRGSGGAAGNYASKARDIFSDLDYKDYIVQPPPSVVQSVKELVDELLWKYTSVLMAQPFEVAKTILQVRSQDDPGLLGIGPEEAIKRRKPSRQASTYNELPEWDSDGDEPAYFTSNIPGTPTPGPRAHRQKQGTPLSSPHESKSMVPEYQITIRNPDSVLEVISQLWTKEAAWGVWRASNATFVYSVLQSLIENWSRSLLSALFNVPDLGVKDDMDRLIDIASPYPWASLSVAAAAAIVTGLALSPLDLVRTRLIVTPISRSSRRTLAMLRNLPSYFCPRALFVPTVLHSLVQPLLTLSTPLVLRTRFLIDRELSPVTFSVAKFCTSSVALFVKLPLETVLRRGQVSVLSSPSYLTALDRCAPASTTSSNGTKGRRLGGDGMETIVPPGMFDGLLGTMYVVVNEEGSRTIIAGPAAAKGKTGAVSKKGKAQVAETVYRRGQGVEGLWRGWKVSWWGLVGLWAAGVAGGGGNGEF